MTNEDAIDVLSDLSQMSADGAKGFKDAAEAADDGQLKSLFADRALQCDSAVTELNSCIVSLGGKAPDGGSIAGSAHRVWQKIRAALTDSDMAALEEVERGEDYAKAAYTKAIKADLPPVARTLVQKQYDGVLKNHDRIRDLRNAYRANAN